MTTPKSVDVLIIGAGPSGLAAANHCLHEGMDFLVVELGNASNKRNHAISQELAKGVGGAGLFSDGKLSYYPSAHVLYSLPSTLTLKKAFSWFHNLTSDIVQEHPEYPKILMPEMWHQKQISPQLLEKEYYSIYLSNEQLDSIINRLVVPISQHIKTCTEVTAITKCNEGYTVDLQSPTSNDTFTLTANSIIFCGGRFGPLMLHKAYPSSPMIFRRFEYGVRIEQERGDFFTNKFPTLDTKLILNDRNSELQWRTFCCCQKGKVFESEFCGIHTYSGARWDSDKSNVGFNVRIREHKTFESAANEIQALLKGKVKPFKLSLADFLANDIILGKSLTSFLWKGLKELQGQFDIHNANIYGPCIEGVGFYPNLTAELSLKNNEDFFVAGDSTGIFRGLLAALISGYYAAERACKNRIKQIVSTNANVTIKKSSIEHMPVIFTAQSKRFFLLSGRDLRVCFK